MTQLFLLIGKFSADSARSVCNIPGNTHLSSSKGLELPSQKSLSPSWQTYRGTRPEQSASSLCRRGRWQVGAGIYSTPWHQVIPPYWVMLQVCHQHSKPKICLPSSRVLANDWPGCVCQEGAFWVAQGGHGAGRVPGHLSSQMDLPQSRAALA